MTTDQIKHRRRLLAVGAVTLLVCCTLVLIKVSAVGVPRHESQLRESLETNRLLERTISYSRERLMAYPPGPVTRYEVIPDWLRRAGAKGMLVFDESADVSGRYVLIEFGGGFGTSGLVIGNKGFDAQSADVTGRLRRWEPGVWYRSD